MKLLSVDTGTYRDRSNKLRLYTGKIILTQVCSGQAQSCSATAQAAYSLLILHPAFFTSKNRSGVCMRLLFPHISCGKVWMMKNFKVLRNLQTTILVMSHGERDQSQHLSNKKEPKRKCRQREGLNLCGRSHMI